MKLILKQAIWKCLLIGIPTAIFGVLGWFYSLPLEAIGYGIVLVIAIGGTIIVLDVYRQVRLLAILEKSLEFNIQQKTQNFPEAITPEAQLFRGALIGSLESFQRYENHRLDIEHQRHETTLLWMHQIKTPIAALQLLIGDFDCSKSSMLSDLEAMKIELFKIEQYAELALHKERLESPTKDLVLCPISVEGIIRATVKKLRLLFIRHQVTLKLDMQETIPKIVSDEKWLAIALEQFITNAIKYGRGGTLTISLSQESLEGVKICISDTGVGIAPEDLPRIFEKGYTGYHGRHDKRATGLGLYIAKQVLDLLSISVEIASQVNVGTKVQLNIPHSDKPTLR